ncbi:MAG: hypothetical protein Q9195_000491 [Heterodermia aff. obscurata]
MKDGPFDSLLNLEEQSYQEGYDLGVNDGTQAGLLEGRLFGLEKGFEKYVTMGTLHGRSVLWAGLLPQSLRGKSSGHDVSQVAITNDTEQCPQREGLPAPGALPLLQSNARLEKHIRILYALTEPSSLSTENSEDSVSDFDDRLKRAGGKIKMIENSLGESDSSKQLKSESSRNAQVVQVDGHAKDVSSLQTGH